MKQVDTAKKHAGDAENKLRCELSLYIFCGSHPGPFGIGVADLLHGVQKYGSLYKAAEDMGMAYSKAWKIVNHIEEYLDFQLLIRQVGRGCGSSLTVRGLDFLKRYDALLEEMRALAKDRFARHFSDF